MYRSLSNVVVLKPIEAGEISSCGSDRSSVKEIGKGAMILMGCVAFSTPLGWGGGCQNDEPVIFETKSEENKITRKERREVGKEQGE